VDGTTSNNPIMRLTDQLMDTFLVPQSSSSSQSAGGQQGGGFQEVSMVARSRGVPGHQGVLQNNNQAMAQVTQLLIVNHIELIPYVELLTFYV
jgi:hypothetical protein